MTKPLVLALPSKGRLKEPVEAWLADCGLPLRAVGGDRGYAARLDGLEGVDVRLVAAGEIADALWAGDVHLGVTGEDLLRETGADLDTSVMLIQALGFGRADLVVAAPKSWIDVTTMADVDEVAHTFLARTGRRLRVATKYVTQTRAFFARHGVTEHRIVESSGATEGAPAAGAAELIADITTTGATLAANGLKPLADGLILSSQAQLAASLEASWTRDQLEAARRLVGVLEARARARRMSLLSWPPESEPDARAALAQMPTSSARPQPYGAIVNHADVFDTVACLAQRGVGPVAVAAAAYVFEPSSKAIDSLALRLGQLN